MGKVGSFVLAGRGVHGDIWAAICGLRSSYLSTKSGTESSCSQETEEWTSEKKLELEEKPVSDFSRVVVLPVKKRVEGKKKEHDLIRRLNGERIHLL